MSDLFASVDQNNRIFCEVLESLDVRMHVITRALSEHVCGATVPTLEHKGATFVDFGVYVAELRKGARRAVYDTLVFGDTNEKG